MINAGGSTGPEAVYNNTFLSSSNNGFCIDGGSNTLTFENNIAIACGYSLIWSSGTLTSDYNIWFNTVNQWESATTGGCCANFATWQGLGFDAHSRGNNNPGILNAASCETGNL